VIEDGRLVGFVDQASVGRYLQAGGRTGSLAHDRAEP